MTQEEKELLLINLCSRLPNGVKCKILENNEIKILSSIQYDGENTLFDFWEDDQKIQYGYQLYLSEFKPYLFPISCMTEEQYEEFIIVSGWNSDIEDIRRGKFLCLGTIGIDYIYDTIDWLNKKHFDYRGLISMGLAIDASKLNIY